MDGQNIKFDDLKKKLEDKNQEVKKRIIDTHRDALMWASNNTKQIALGAMGGFLLLTTPATGFLQAHNKVQNEKFVDVPEDLFVVSDIKPYLPEKVGILLPQQEEKISDILTNYYGFKITPDVNGLRLQNTYGYIGLEQHLMRYPGDNIEEHFGSNNDALEFAKNGMAPGRGAFGYFAESKETMTQYQKDEEKYYIAVQTFLAPSYAVKASEYRDFFKFRKMIVINPNNGRAVVVVIGDSGPAVFTGKQLGGSPEVMDYLGRVDGAGKGAVLYFFIDDPTNSVPLGPVEPKKNQSL